MLGRLLNLLSEIKNMTVVTPFESFVCESHPVISPNPLTTGLLSEGEEGPCNCRRPLRCLSECNLYHLRGREVPGLILVNKGVEFIQ